MVKKECFSDLIDHGHGKYTLFGRVLADTPDDPGRQNVRSADITIPSGLEIEHYVVSATFVTEDSDDPHRGKPFFQCTSEHNPDARAIAVVGGTMQIQANMSANLS